MAQVPSVGRVVHYILPAGRSKGQHRPALIVRVRAPVKDGQDEQPRPDTAVQLQVFTDSTNDELPQVLWATSVVQGDQPGQWHWPEYVPPHTDRPTDTDLDEQD